MEGKAHAQPPGSGHGEHFSEELLADLALSCALWLGMGRVLRTLDIAQSCKLTLPSRV